MEASSNMKAVQVLCQHKAIGLILSPFLDIEKDEIDWKRISYGSLPGGYQAAISWAFSLFCDRVPPTDWNYRDPFDSFGVMDRDIQVLALEAMAIRHGFVKMSLEDKPKSDFQKMIETVGAEMDKEAKKENLKLLK